MKAVLLLALTSAGCTLESGRGFATLESVELHAHFEPGEDHEVDGGVLSDLGYVVRLDEIRVELRELELRALAQGAEPTAAGEHDHCHEDCSEAEEPAEAHTEGEALETLATFPIDRGVDALAGEELYLTEVSPSRELPQAQIERAELGVGRIDLVGSVSAGGLASEVPLSVSLDLNTHAEAELDLAITHDGPEQLALHAELSLEGPLFDGVDFAATDGFMPSDGDERAEALRRALAAALHLHVAPAGHP